MIRTLILSLVLCFPAACSAVPYYAGFEGVSVIATEKTMEDHVISLASGKNCSVVRLERGMTYCEEDEVIPKPEVYCYQELGDVTCYEAPDPTNPDRSRVGINEHNYIQQH